MQNKGKYFKAPRKHPRITAKKIKIPLLVWKGEL